MSEFLTMELTEKKVTDCSDNMLQPCKTQDLDVVGTEYISTYKVSPLTKYLRKLNQKFYNQTHTLGKTKSSIKYP